MVDTSEIKPATNTSEGNPKNPMPNLEKGTSGPNLGHGPNSYKPKTQSHSSQSPTTTFRGHNNKSQTPAAHGRLKPPFWKLTPTRSGEARGYAISATRSGRELIYVGESS